MLLLNLSNSKVFFYLLCFACLATLSVYQSYFTINVNLCNRTIQDERTKIFLELLLETGVLEKLANSMYDNSGYLITSSDYSHLNLTDCSFYTIDNKPISTAVIVRTLQRVSISQPIPNTVHFFQYSENALQRPELRFHQYLAFLGALWFSEADYLVVWCNLKPDGVYWNQFVKNLTVHGLQNRILIATRPLPTRVFNQPIRVIQHQIDVMKLQISILIGGIFLDSDAVTLRSLQPLRKHNCVIGRESSYGLSIGAFMSKASAKFELIWYLVYQNFQDADWATHSVMLPNKIWEMFPKLCHVEDDTIVRPTWMEPEISMLYKPFNGLKVKWDWSKNYIVHLWNRGVRPSENEITVKNLDSMYGQIARYVLFGNITLFNSPLKEF